VTDRAAEPVRLCFVCLGNICRSPTAEGVMARLVADAGLADRIEVDSAGTAAWHAGEEADPRSMAEARRRGVELTSRARQFHPGDFYRYDLVLAMDSRNLVDLRDLAPEHHLRDRARLLRAFDPALAVTDTAGGERGPFALDVPDPYYEADDGFRTVFEMVEAACRGLLDHVRTRLL
jgi:protein-tyrosine phosphatase